jgi:hypothetical protein
MCALVLYKLLNIFTMRYDSIRPALIIHFSISLFAYCNLLNNTCFFALLSLRVIYRIAYCNIKWRTLFARVVQYYQWQRSVNFNVFFHLIFHTFNITIAITILLPMNIQLAYWT